VTKVPRHAKAPSQHKVTAHALRDFQVNYLQWSGEHIEVVSVSSEGQLLAYVLGSCEIHVYEADGSAKSTISLPWLGEMCDAAFTSNGNIVCTLYDGEVVVMSKSGAITSSVQLSDPRCLSVCSDGTIYVADRRAGVYQSTNDGKKFRHVFRSHDNGDFWQVIRVSSTPQSHTFWALKVFDGDSMRLMVYTVNKHRSEDNVQGRNIALPPHVDLRNAAMVLDSKRNLVYITDRHNRAVHALSVASERYVCQLLSPQHFSNTRTPECLTVNDNVMYVGQTENAVGVFRLT
jgi:hypothetical protein